MDLILFMKITGILRVFIFPTIYPYTPGLPVYQTSIALIALEPLLSTLHLAPQAVLDLIYLRFNNHLHPTGFKRSARQWNSSDTLRGHYKSRGLTRE